MSSKARRRRRRERRRREQETAARTRSNGASTVIHWPHDGWFQQGYRAGERATETAFSPVFQCINLISDDIAKLRLRHLRIADDGTKSEVPNSPVTALLRRPNQFQTTNDLLKALMVSLLWKGNGYLFLRPNERGDTTESLHVISPDRVSPQVAVDGSVHYSVSLDALEMPGFAERRAFNVPERYMLHHRTLYFRHPLNGISPLHAAAQSTQAGLIILESQAEFFENRSRPSGVLSTDKRLSEQGVKRLTEQWEESYGRGGTGKIALLEEGMKFEPISVAAKDAEQLQMLVFLVEDVARAYKVPKYMLGDLSGVTYSNGETLQRFYYANCLQAHIEALEARLTRQFNLPANELLEFDLDGLLRAETAIRIDSLQKGVMGGLFAPNEARRKEGLNPVEGGDVPFMQRQMVPVSVLANSTLETLNGTPPGDKSDPFDVSPETWERELREFLH